VIVFERMRVISRLVVTGFVVFVGLALIAGYTLVQIRSDALAAHSERIKNLVESSVGIIGNYQKLEAEKKLTREEAQLQAKEALRSPRFGTNDYYFLYDFDGRALMVAGNPKIEGQVLLGKTDAAGFKLWDALVEKGKSGKGYFDYVFPRAGETISKPKRGYVIGIPEWKWIVGTGVYVDDVDAAVNKAALRYAGLSLVILAVMAVLGVLVSRSIINQLGGEPGYATDCMKKIASGDLGIEIALKAGDESSLIASLKMMQAKLKNITAAIQGNSSALNEQVQRFDGVAKSYAQTKSEDDLFALNSAVKKLGKSGDMLAKSVSRFKL
jgi:methyl-accepting chemotaxis protein